MMMLVMVMFAIYGYDDGGTSGGGGIS